MSDLDVHLAAIQAGDADAFAAWLAGAEEPVRRSLGRFAAVVDVEVVLQEALLRAWQFAPRVAPDGQGNSLLRYTLRVARNLAIDEARRARREEALEAAPEPATPAVAPPDPALRRWLRACLDALPPRPRAALAARLGADGGTHDRELAASVEMTVNTFLQNVGRARRLLLACLEGHGVRVEEGLP